MFLAKTHARSFIREDSTAFVHVGSPESDQGWHPVRPAHCRPFHAFPNHLLSVGGVPAAACRQTSCRRSKFHAAQDRFELTQRGGLILSDRD